MNDDCSMQHCTETETRFSHVVLLEKSLESVDGETVEGLAVEMISAASTTTASGTNLT
jgi:hypothetical protein